MRSAAFQTVQFGSNEPSAQFKFGFGNVGCGFKFNTTVEQGAFNQCARDGRHLFEARQTIERP
jgi:hypothetical protein